MVGLVIILEPRAPEPRVHWPAALGLATVSASCLFAVLARAVPSPARVRSERVPALAATATYVTILAAAEELLWRGIVLAAAASLLGLVTAMALSVAGFALTHVRAQGPTAALVHLVTGSTFSFVFVISGSLAAAVLAHGLYNVLVALRNRIAASRDG
jgi:membrane protease YdiL (CAAX protease family)